MVFVNFNCFLVFGRFDKFSVSVFLLVFAGLDGFWFLVCDRFEWFLVFGFWSVLAGLDGFWFLVDLTGFCVLVFGKCLPVWAVFVCFCSI